MSGPLTGLRIVDLTRILAGPFATMILSDMGAEVIKVERPEGGDLSRGTGPFIKGESYYFVSVNRGKQSVTLNLAHPDGQQALKDIAAQCDVLVENFVPGAMANFGLSYEALAEVNPRLVYCSISGFGQTGPYAQRPALDIIVQAMGGIMSITGEPGGGPVRPGSSLGDIIAGLFATTSILAALQERERSGQGQHIDVSMLECQLAILEAAVGRYVTTGESPGPIGTRHPSFTPFQAFKTADDWIVVAIVGGVRDQWPLFCAAIDRVDLIDDPRYTDGYERTQNYDALIPELEAAMLRKPAEQWLQEFSEIGIACGPVNRIDQVLSDPQINYRGAMVEVPHKRVGSVPVVNSPIRFSRTPGDNPGPAPDLGEHNETVLGELAGYAAETLERLRAEGVIGADAEYA